MAYKHILAATDFSEAGDAAITRAIELASVINAKLTLLHVVHVSPAGYPPEIPYVPLLVPEQLTKVLENAKHELQKRLPSTLPTTVAVECIAREGWPRETILETAKGFDTDLIVLGSHGRRGLSRLLLGSVAEGVVRLASISVLVAR